LLALGFPRGRLPGPLRPLAAGAGGLAEHGGASVIPESGARRVGR
jgi:hypothetical protein